MAEEEKTGLQTEENTEKTGEAENTDSQTETGTPEKTEKVNWEKRYADLQADHTRVSQRVATYERESQEREESALQAEEPDYDGDSFVDGKTVGKIVDKAVSKAVSEAVSQMRMQTADSYFRRAYPKIVKHENIISGILRNPKDPQSLKGASSEERIDAAVKEFNELTVEAIATAKEETETEAKERDEKNRKATGLGGPSTTPSKGDEGKSDAEELADRRAASAKKRNLA